MKRKYTLVLLLVIPYTLCFFAFFASDAKTDAFIGTHYEEFLQYTIQDDNKERTGTSEVHVTTTKKGSTWHEKRASRNGSIDIFDITYNNENLLPISYKRTIIQNKITKNINIRIESKKIVMEIKTTGKDINKQSIPMPKKRFIFEPFLKKYIGIQLKKGIESEDLEIITLFNEKLRNLHVEWRNSGIETVEVQAGSFTCFKVILKSKNFFIKMLMPQSTIWLDTEGTNKVIRATGKWHRLSGAKTTELVDYFIQPVDQ